MFPRIALAQLPTPLEFADRLSAAWGTNIWIKRDDLTGFGLSGNKVRKLEFHMAAAQAAGAEVVITCGAAQSNHCRATALVAARLGLKCVLVSRTESGEPPGTLVGNHFLQRLAGAEVRYISRAEWVDRAEIMDTIAAEFPAGAWTMPAGASDRLGVAAFEMAMVELDGQVAAEAPIPGDADVTVWHASSSGGTTAGLALGAAASSRQWRVVGSSVGESEAELVETVTDLLAETEVPLARFEIVDRYVGLGYGRTTDQELAVQVEATRMTGQIWDPTYTGKALYGLSKEIEAGRFGPDDHVVFWHTGGGFAAFAHDFGNAL